jgi:hypothetical protein
MSIAATVLSALVTGVRCPPRTLGHLARSCARGAEAEHRVRDAAVGMPILSSETTPARPEERRMPLQHAQDGFQYISLIPSVYVLLESHDSVVSWSPLISFQSKRGACGAGRLGQGASCMWRTHAHRAVLRRGARRKNNRFGKEGARSLSASRHAAPDTVSRRARSATESPPETPGRRSSLSPRVCSSPHQREVTVEWCLDGKNVSPPSAFRQRVSHWRPSCGVG